MQICKSEFIDILNKLQDSHQFARDFQDLLDNSRYQHDFLNGDMFFDSEEEQIIINLLCAMFDDTSRWIDYWVCELDCGLANWCDEAVKDRDGTPIPIKTSEDVWNIIHNQK